MLIDAANEVPEALAFLVKHHAASGISPVTTAEVLAGATAKNLSAFRAWLSAFEYLPLDLPSVDLAAQLRREKRWKLPDAFLAALTLRHGLKLVTRNTKDFPPDKLDFVLAPYKS